MQRTIKVLLLYSNCVVTAVHLNPQIASTRFVQRVNSASTAPLTAREWTGARVTRRNARYLLPNSKPKPNDCFLIAFKTI